VGCVFERLDRAGGRRIVDASSLDESSPICFRSNQLGPDQGLPFDIALFS